MKTQKQKKDKEVESIKYEIEGYIDELCNKRYDEEGESVWSFIFTLVFLMFAIGFFLDELNWHYGLGALFFLILSIITSGKNKTSQGGKMKYKEARRLQDKILTEILEKKPQLVCVFKGYDEQVEINRAMTKRIVNVFLWGLIILGGIIGLSLLITPFLK